MNEKPYKLSPDQTIVACCGWCFPGSSILSTFPELTGRKISHGICATHKAEMMKEMEAMSHLSRPVGK